MVDVSNKTLAVILMASIFVSIGGTVVSLNSLGQTSGLTGYALTDQATASINITGDLSIEFAVDQVDFGAGFTNDTGAGIEYCTFDTNGTNPSGSANCSGFNDDLSPFTIENIGNQDAALALQFDEDAASLLGGTSPGFEYAVENNVTDACDAGLTSTSFTTVTTGSSTVCSNFNFDTGSDLLNLHIRVSVPQDATVGFRQATVTATAS